jgi:hypothetical protein
MEETSWVRSVYLYVMCFVSIVLIGVGAVASITGLVHTVAPDLGHRDAIDRFGIGVANIATNVVDLLDETQISDSEEFCRDVTDNADDFDECMEDETLGDESMAAIQDGISEVKSELRSQIRNNSIDQLIRGLLIIGVGILLFRIHGERTELFADGVMPKREVPPPTEPPDPVPLAPLPPPPGGPTA